MPEARPADAPGRLRELSDDVRAALLLDARGALAGASGHDPVELAEAARELLSAVDESADSPPPELEAHAARGSVYAVRSGDWTLLAVARRAALPALVRYDMRAVLAELSGEREIRVAPPAEEAE